VIASASLRDQELKGGRRVQRLGRWGHRFIGVAIVGAGVVVGGWVTGVRHAAAPITGDHVVKANSAIAIAALGIVFLWDPGTARARRARVVVGAAVICVGLVTVLQWVTGWSIGVDEAVIEDRWAAGGTAAGRPAPMIAIVLVLLGAAAVVRDRRSGVRDAALGLASALSLGTLLGHAFGVDGVVVIGDTYAVPVEASLLTSFLSLGASLSSPPSRRLRPLLTGSSPTSALARGAIAVAVLLPLLGGLSFHLVVDLGVDETTAAWLITMVATGLALLAVLQATSTIGRLSTQLRTFMDTLPEGVYETAFDGTLLVANDPLGRLLGYRDASHLLTQVANVTALWVEPERRASLIADLEAGVAAGTRDVELRRRDGSTFVAELSFQAVTANDGHPQGLRGTIRDVTEARNLQDQVAQAEQRFRLAFNTGSLGRAVLDLNTRPPRFLAVNDQLAAMLGYTPDEMVALGPESFVAPDDLPLEEALIRSAILDGDGLVEYDARRRHRDGTWVPIHLSGGVARDESGRTRFAISTIEDLRPRLAAEQELERTRHMLEAFIENVPASVYMVDRDGRFLLVNQATERVIGAPRRDLVGRRRSEIRALGANGRAHRRNDLVVLNTGRSYTCEERLGAGDDERIFLSVKFPLTGPDGAVFGVGGVSTDITELLRLRSETERAWAETTRRLAIAVEYRDEETGAHVERMAAYCELIATHLHDPGLDPARIRAAAALHDGSTRRSVVGGVVLMRRGESSMERRSAGGAGACSSRSCGTRSRVA
jgi:PAS domain S-box-containing protein